MLEAIRPKHWNKGAIRGSCSKVGTAGRGTVGDFNPWADPNPGTNIVAEMVNKAAYYVVENTTDRDYELFAQPRRVGSPGRRAARWNELGTLYFAEVVPRGPVPRNVFGIGLLF